MRRRWQCSVRRGRAKQVYLNFAERGQAQEMNISQLKLNLHLILLANRSHRSPDVTVAVEPVHAARIEVQVVSVVAVVRVERTRPVAAVVACIVEIGVVAIAHSRKKN